jgi:hypothetical protein
MTSLTITLPDDVAKVAQEQGLLTTAALEAYLLENAKKYDKPTEYPSGFDMRLKVTVNPSAYHRGQILGDIVSPINQARSWLARRVALVISHPLVFLQASNSLAFAG